MSFRRQSDRSSIWVPPSTDEIARRLDALINPVSDSQVEVPVGELQNQLAAAVGSMLPRIDSFSGKKDKLYSAVLSATSKERGPVDIIMPVYNSIHIVEKAIQAVISRTSWPYRLIIVDDVSDEFTRTTLKQYADKYPQILLTLNVKNKGFAATVNKGISLGKGKYIVLLNSDVIVTPGWLTKLIFALEADPRNQIVNPVTNNTALINVPMSPGASYLDMNWILQNRGEVKYPEIMPTGFCYGFRRSLLSEIGPFDEDLSLDTPVLTSQGWKTIGTLEIGNEVFTPEGTRSKVSYLHPIYTNKPCYRITFDTGDSIVCSDRHRWIVKKKWANYKSERIVHLSAEGLFKNFCHVSKRGKRQFRYWIEPTSCLKYDECALPIEPYIFGIWLGDGNSSSGKLTIADKDITDKIVSNGWALNKLTGKYLYSVGTCKTKPYKDTPNGQCFTHDLRNLGVLNNKHIPEIYLHNSLENRLELLKGLMDSDGSCRKGGYCEFVNTNKTLIDQAYQLITSLGIKARIRRKPDNRKPSYKDVFVIEFMIDFPVFYVGRKYMNQATKLQNKSLHHRIVNIEKVDSVPVRCITIDSDRHLFLAGKSLIPTSNSYPNFGEESDHWMKTITYRRGPMVKGYRAVLADDTYVYHERGSSFSSLGEEKHMGFRKQAADRFHRVWPQFGQWKKTFHIDKALSHIKAPIPMSVINGYRKVPYRLCWLVRSAAYPCGGMEYITDVTNELIERGVDVKIVVVGRGPQYKIPEPNGELRCGVINFDTEEDLLKNFSSKVFKNGVVIASTSELAPILARLSEVEKKIKPVLHVQSYEPDLLGEGHPAQSAFRDNFKVISNVVSSSHWITKKLISDGVNVIATISPGVDRRMFYPGNRSLGDDRLTVMVPVSAMYPYKGYNRAVSLLQNLYNKSVRLGMNIRLLTYGMESIPEVCGTAIALGLIPQTRLAKILREEVDVFIDPSYNHSYGMPCIEAMASGVPVICWDNKGIGEYVKHGKNGLKLPNSMHPTEVADSVLKLLEDEEQRKTLRTNALASLDEHDRALSVNSLIETVEKSLGLKQTKRKIVFVTPHLRKHGGPTTILSLANALSDRGHEVSITSVYPDVSPEVLGFTDLPINLDHKDIPECDILIVNSDSDISSFFADLPQAKKKIMLKLSHNARFKEFEEASLALTWNKIITSTEWLANVCRNPLPGWNNKPVDATRIGWFHYGHETFKISPHTKQFRQGTPEEPIRICTLIHPHPLKGTNDAILALRDIKEKFGDSVKIEGVGEYPQSKLLLPPWIKYHESLSRQGMADLFKNTNIWVGVSHTEGLGRMALEAMSSSLACVLTDVHTEFTEHDKNCLLVPIGRPDLISASVISLLQDRARLIKMAIEGYQTAESHNDPSDCIDNLERAIEEVMMT